MTTSQLGKYAKDAAAWRHWAKIYYTASVTLFDSGNLFLWIPAATLGHHALERYLKAALICEGMVAFDPGRLGVNASPGFTKADCAWGHGLVALAGQLSAKRKDFDLDAKLNLPDSLFIGMSETDLSSKPDPPDPSLISMPDTIRAGFGLFDPFFSELRYPEELDQVKEIGQELKFVLERLMELLKPFAQEMSFSLYI